MGQDVVNLSGLTPEEEGVISEIAEAIGTPVYVYFTGRIKERIEQIPEILASGTTTKYCYALLANSNPYIFQYIVQEFQSQSKKSGVLASSAVDLLLLRKVFSLPDDLSLVYADSALSEEGLSECEHLLQQGFVSDVYLILQNKGQFDRFAKRLSKSKCGYHVGLRVKIEGSDEGTAHSLHSGRFSRFGMTQSEICECVNTISNIRNEKGSIGFHIYPGTNLSVDKLMSAYRKFLDIVSQAVGLLGNRTIFLDFGGGFGINYKTREIVDIGCVVKQLSDIITGSSVKDVVSEVLLEPGRLIVGPSAVLVSQVVDVVGDTPKFVFLDTGLSHFARPYIYRCLDESLWSHQLKVLGKQDIDDCDAFVVGATMASGDFLAGDPARGAVKVPSSVRRGDLVCLMDVGAYGYCMTSNFSGLLRPPEVLVKSDGGSYKWCVVRRRETYEALMEEVPSCLEWH